MRTWRKRGGVAICSTGGGAGAPRTASAHASERESGFRDAARDMNAMGDRKWLGKNWQRAGEVAQAQAPVEPNED